MAVSKVNDIHMAAAINEMDDTTTNLILFSIYSSCLIVGNCKHCRKVTCILANTCPCRKQWCLFFMFDPKTYSLMLCCTYTSEFLMWLGRRWAKEGKYDKTRENMRNIKLQATRKFNIRCTIFCISISPIQSWFATFFLVGAAKQISSVPPFRVFSVWRSMKAAVWSADGSLESEHFWYLAVAGGLECCQRWLPFYLHLLVS